MLTVDELNQAKELAIRLKTQNNRGTATPIWFLLQDVEERFDPVNGGDFKLYLDDCGEVWRGEDNEDILKQMMEEIDPLDFGPLDDKSEYEDYISKLESDIEDESYGMTHEFVTKRIFFTEEAANDHLKLNKHHYSDKARIYVDHAWRDPEAELIYTILTSFA